MRQPAYSGQFKRDVKLAQKRGKNMDKLKAGTETVELAGYWLDESDLAALR